jgi:hypothetical protein
MSRIINKEDEAHPSHPNYPVNVTKRELAAAEKAEAAKALAEKKLADEKAAAEKAEADKLNKK